MTILSKVCKPDNFESHNSLKLSFTNYAAFVHLLIVNISLNQTLLTFLLYVRQTWMIDWCKQFLCERLSSFNPKGFKYWYAWSRSLCEGRTSFFTGRISRKLCRFLLMFSTGFTSLSVLLLFSLSITFFVFMHGFRFYFI